MNPLPRRLTKYTSLAIPIIIICGSVFYLSTILVPKLTTTRQTIDDQRASIVALQHQQANITQLRQEFTTIAKDDETMKGYAWAFTDEEAFFSFWESLAQKNSLKLDGPSIAEAIPSGSLLLRPATITIQGSTANILAALDQIQTQRPLVSIDQLSMTGDTATSVAVTLELKTVWK